MRDQERPGDDGYEEEDEFDAAARRARELILARAEEDDEFEEEEEEESEEDSDGPSRTEAFEVMTPTQFNAHRLDAWQMAHAELTKHNWGADYNVDPADVLILARFIEGDDLGD